MCHSSERKLRFRGPSVMHFLSSVVRSLYLRMRGMETRRSGKARQYSNSRSALSSDSLIVTHLGLSFLIEFEDGVVDGQFEVFDGLESLVGEEVALEVSPGSLDVVEFRRIFWQPLDGQPGSFGERRAGQFAGVNWAVVEHQHNRRDRPPRLRSVAVVELFQKSDEIGAALAGTDMDDQFATAVVEHAEQRPLAGLTRCWDAQVRTASCPGVRQIGMCQGLRFIAKQQDNVTSFGLLAQQTQAQTGPIDRLRILPAIQAVAGAPPSEPPFFSVLLSCDLEIVNSVRAVNSACNRGNVQFARSVTGSDKTSPASASAASLLNGAAPACAVARKPSTPSARNHVRQRRTLSAVTPNARAIWPLVHPFNDNRMARARSASSRRADRANASNPATSEAVATTRGRPTMTQSTLTTQYPRSYQMWRGQGNPA